MHTALTTIKPFARIALIVLLVLSCAYCHVTDLVEADVTSGFSHPLEGWDHIVTMLGVGIWAAQLRGKSIWLLPLTFVSVMSLGGISGAASYLAVPSAELLILLSCLVFSALIIRKVRFNTQINVLIVAFFAFFHGYAHGQEISTSASLLSYTLGFMLATLLLHGTGILVTKVILLAVTFLIASFSQVGIAQKASHHAADTPYTAFAQVEHQSQAVAVDQKTSPPPTRTPQWLTCYFAPPISLLCQPQGKMWLTIALVKTGLEHCANGVGLTSPPQTVTYFSLALLICAFVISQFFCYVFCPASVFVLTAALPLVLPPCFIATLAHPAHFFFLAFIFFALDPNASVFMRIQKNCLLCRFTRLL